MSSKTNTATTSPAQSYEQQLERGLQADHEQARVITLLEALFQQLTNPRRLLPGKPAKGLYLHGSVGIGKTFLMDMFYECLPQGRKRRLHFHAFMKEIHNRLRQQSGTCDPLESIGGAIAREIDVLCLDELLIIDIADAMIVYRLFESLFSHKVTLVITSNFPVNRLYRDDLQPGIFQPAINLIQASLPEVCMNSSTDYRRRLETDESTFFLSDEIRFSELFTQLTGQRPVATAVSVLKRQIPTQGVSNQLIWFDFADICDGPRSAQDYLAISLQYRTILVSGVPIFSSSEDSNSVVMGIEDGEGISTTGAISRRQFSNEDNAARRFISLVDVLYDNGNRLILSAECHYDHIYQGQALTFEFTRTRSRLTEMQSSVFQQAFHQGNK